MKRLERFIGKSPLKKALYVGIWGENGKELSYKNYKRRKILLEDFEIIDSALYSKVALQFPKVKSKNYHEVVDLIKVFDEAGNLVEEGKIYHVITLSKGDKLRLPIHGLTLGI